jgi:hypothetical protein
MNWNEESQTRFDQLRMKAISGTLPQPERAELEDLFAQVETDEANYLAPALFQMGQEQVELRKRLADLQAENELLVKLLTQQEQFIVDNRNRPA